MKTKKGKIVTRKKYKIWQDPEIWLALVFFSYFGITFGLFLR